MWKSDILSISLSNLKRSWYHKLHSYLAILNNKNSNKTPLFVIKLGKNVIIQGNSKLQQK